MVLPAPDARSIWARYRAWVPAWVLVYVAIRPIP